MNPSNMLRDDIKDTVNHAKKLKLKKGEVGLPESLSNPKKFVKKMFDDADFFKVDQNYENPALAIYNLHGSKIFD
jgi:hypothetical protein